MLDLLMAADSAAQRLDVFLARTLPGASRQRVRALIAGGGVRVNGRRVHKSAALQPGDAVQIDDWSDPGAATLLSNASLDVPILYEDTEVIALDKPAGLPSHALRADETATLANFLVDRFPELRALSRAVGKDEREPGLVHRLDTDTSGVLLVARTVDAYAALRRQFRAHTVNKEYVALVDGDVAASGEITAPIAHDARNRRRMRVCDNPDQAVAWHARPALTRYRPLRRLGTRTVLAIEIPTGLRHQIRAHLAFVGHPIIGDELYGGRGAARQMLHAERVTFTHPRTRERVTVESPLPADLRATLGHRPTYT
ncbi:MAG: RluA family pseudouridine synthase [Deltaproteobacteria bacterium]|nr:RluA family pseudouridine synthase [Deltaproteobacteria bacterium]MBI3389269.1 RluA family pseudouridine synthase [Deltaproteobacteria bacterium]